MEHPRHSQDSKEQHYKELTYALNANSHSFVEHSNPKDEHLPQQFHYITTPHVEQHEFCIDDQTRELTAALVQTLAPPIIEPMSTPDANRGVIQDEGTQGRAEQMLAFDNTVAMGDTMYKPKQGKSRARLGTYDPFPSPGRKAVHRCPECFKVFKRAHNLKIHGRLHTGDRPFICPFEHCGKDFKWKSSVVSHINWHKTKRGDILHGDINKHIIVNTKSSNGQTRRMTRRNSGGRKNGGKKGEVMRSGSRNVKSGMGEELAGMIEVEAEYGMDKVGDSEWTFQEMMTDGQGEGIGIMEKDVVNTPSTTIEWPESGSPTGVVTGEIDGFSILKEMDGCVDVMDSSGAGLLTRSLSEYRGEGDVEGRGSGV